MSTECGRKTCQMHSLDAPAWTHSASRPIWWALPDALSNGSATPLASSIPLSHSPRSHSLCCTRNEYMHLIKVLVAGSSSESIHVACIDTRQRKSPVQLTTPPTSNRTETHQANHLANIIRRVSRAGGNCCLANKSKLQLNKIANFNDDRRHKFAASLSHSCNLSCNDVVSTHIHPHISIVCVFVYSVWFVKLYEWYMATF